MTSRPRIRITILGLDGSGKTTLLEQWKARYESSLPPVPLDRIRPTTGVNVATCTVAGADVEIYDVAGTMRNLWQSYVLESDALLFVVDASNTHRVEEARSALQELIHDGSLDEHVAIVVVANKQDLDGAQSAVGIRNSVLDPAAAEARASVEAVSAPEPGTPSMRPASGAWQGGAFSIGTASGDLGTGSAALSDAGAADGEALGAGKGGKTSPVASAREADFRVNPTRVVEASGWRGQGLDVLEWLVRRVSEARGRRTAREKLLFRRGQVKPRPPYPTV